MRAASFGSAQRKARAISSLSITATAMQAPVRSPFKRLSTTLASAASVIAWAEPLTTASVRRMDGERVMARFRMNS
jgi:hypothetical protein